MEPTPKLIELYLRKDPKTIAYKKESKEKLNLKYVELALRVPCVIFPDPRFSTEDTDIREKRR